VNTVVEAVALDPGTVTTELLIIGWSRVGYPRTREKLSRSFTASLIVISAKNPSSSMPAKERGF
jgi:hypothetical protein